ncbi:MAG: hypothetical protein HY092_01380 [Candidatus Kerfeldbacteria bacterium]|nr:hypothetical protein [Candidatus Kerfeldbacteria bacterium]
MSQSQGVFLYSDDGLGSKQVEHELRQLRVPFCKTDLRLCPQVGSCLGVPYLVTAIGTFHGLPSIRWYLSDSRLFTATS